eukprot:5318769-Karenia_brevis.AAC.1
MYVEDVDVVDDFEATDADCYSTHSDGEEKKVMAWLPFFLVCGGAVLLDGGDLENDADDLNIEMCILGARVAAHERASVKLFIGLS